MLLVNQITGFFKVLYLINEECIMRHAWACPNQTILQSQEMSVLDLLDSLNTAGSSLENQSSILEVVKWANYSNIS